MFFFDVDDIGYYKDLEAVFVEVSSELVPFAIQSINIKGSNTAYVQLEDVATEEVASALVGCSLLLPLTYLPALSGNKFYYHEVIGFEVIDESEGLIGILESVIDKGPQDIFTIRFNDKEVLLPVSDDIIRSVDRKNKKLMVKAPDGLIDLYLST